jgi:hypothetical protein
MESYKVVDCICAKGASNANYSRQLLKAIRRVDGLVTSDEEVRKLMLDREAWRSRIKLRIKKQTLVKEKIASEIRRVKTLKLEGYSYCYLVVAVAPKQCCIRD